MTKVFNRKAVDWTKQPMFFGDEPNTQRFDQQKYPVFEKLNQQQLGFFWRPEEESLQKDRNDYNLLSDEQKHIFTSNLKYQTLLDSVQGRGPCLAFLPFCSLPELESMLVAWDFSETIHSRSYTYIMKNVYPNPTENILNISKEVDVELYNMLGEMVIKRWSPYTTRAPLALCPMILRTAWLPGM